MCFLTLIGFFVTKIILLWSILEIYNILFIVFVFLKKKVVGPTNVLHLVYFGVIQLFRSVGLLLGLFLDFNLMVLFSLLVKMGSFPLKDWVVKFFTNCHFLGGVMFFSVNKFLPLIFFNEFVEVSFSSVLLILVGN